MYTPDRRQSKTFILSMKQRSNSLETEFTIAICRPTGDKWQSKILFLAIFDPRSSIVRSVFDNRLFGVVYGCQNHIKERTHFELLCRNGSLITNSLLIWLVSLSTLARWENTISFALFLFFFYVFGTVI